MRDILPKQPAPAPAAASLEGNSHKAMPTDAVESTILTALRGHGPVPLANLIADLGLGIESYSVIDGLSKRGLLKISGEDGDEEVEILGTSGTGSGQ
jgi:hypothetical protein